MDNYRAPDKRQKVEYRGALHLGSSDNLSEVEAYARQPQTVSKQDCYSTETTENEL